MGAHGINDINVQHGNVTGSMRLRNTKLLVVGHNLCCAIPYMAYCGQAKYEREALYLSSNYIVFNIGTYN